MRRPTLYFDDLVMFISFNTDLQLDGALVLPGSLLAVSINNWCDYLLWFNWW